MVNNYFFRSRGSTRRALLFPIALQLGGTGLFVGSAVFLTAIGMPQDKVLITVFFETVALAVLASYWFHKRDLKLLHNRSWPLDTLQDYYKASVRILPEIDGIMEKELLLQRRVERLLTDNSQLRREAESIRATSVVTKLRKSYSESLEIRKEILDDMKKAREVRTHIESSIQSFESSHDLRREHREIEIKSLNQRVAALRASANELHRREELVDHDQQRAFATAATG